MYKSSVVLYGGVIESSSVSSGLFPKSDPLPLKLAEPGVSYGSEKLGGDGDYKLVEVLVDILTLRQTEDTEDIEQLYTYQVPPHLDIMPGDILSVPFGAQQIGAIAIRLTSELPENLREPGKATSIKLRPVEDITAKGFFPAHYWQLLQQVAQYYQTPLIRAIRTALPPGLLGRSQRRIRLVNDAIPGGAEEFLQPKAQRILQLLKQSATGDYTWQYLQRQIKGGSRGLQDLIKRGWVESYLEPPTPPRPKLRPAITLVIDWVELDFIDITPRQREVLEILRRRGGEMWVTDLLQTCNTSSGLLKTLEKKGCVVIGDREILRTEQGIPTIADQPLSLTEHQQQALDVILGLSGFHQLLLHGVTGSGKTEVYLQAIAPIINQGKSALVLVPEIGLTPQLTDRFRARFGNRVFVYHSGLSEGERYDTWRNMIEGTPQVVIGTRSAIFAPLPNLGLIVLDEEHDSSFKQDQPQPCYHARTVAVWRAELENCPLILGSATPALETWQHHRHNHNPSIHYLSLPERVLSRPQPPVEVVDMRRELKQGNRSIFSRSLQLAIASLRDNNQQGILFIHRRGHSTFVSCRSCGYVMECPRCDVSLSYHHIHAEAIPYLRCHYCNHSQSYPQRCPQCDSPYFKHFGSGTQRVAQELTRLFPQLRFIRFDSDTTRTKNAHRILLTQFANREADLLVGTQMLTKGLDLDSVGLVGIVSADGLLHLSDYRANERAFQTLLQVAGRAGRGNDPGQVILQTYTPEHPVVEAVRNHAYDSFVETELQHRSELNYPPSGGLILLRLRGYDAIDVEQTAHLIASELTSELLPGTCELLGPAPAPIMRVANQYRWQILLKFLPGQTTPPPSLAALAEKCPQSVRFSIDVDPLSFG
ncbi:MAG: primosomal protein N' [Arthrospira sp. PLM2.Bin9]|nr:primosomal protein N' [Arthrospira sp. PLM2.Bin9]TVU54418.1 MAG: primosomal protein N' [Arthrospira sp. PLM2.Bin9]